MLSPVDASRSERGHTLIELLAAMSVLMVVSGTAMSGVLNMTRTQLTVSNRTEMHAGVRNATELLQQEVGQAGRVTLPGTVVLGGGVVAGNATVAVTSASGMFVGQHLVIDTGANEETVTLTGVDTTNNQITAVFASAHAIGAPVNVYGGFSSGVLPTDATNGSTGTVLKLVGDIHGTGQMVYVEYSCDTVAGNLYRRSMPYDTDPGSKPAITADMALLNNVVANPDGTPCFTYQEQTANGTTFVVGVAITLTVQTRDKDPVTGLYQTETKALLNVSPRNVFNVWQLAGLGITNRVQPTPATVTALLP